MAVQNNLKREISWKAMNKLTGVKYGKFLYEKMLGRQCPFPCSHSCSLQSSLQSEPYLEDLTVSISIQDHPSSPGHKYWWFYRSSAQGFNSCLHLLIFFCLLSPYFFGSHTKVHNVSRHFICFSFAYVKKCILKNNCSSRECIEIGLVFFNFSGCILGTSCYFTLWKVWNK